MPASELIERVSQLIETNAARLGGEVQSELDSLSSRLREPLRVAIVGRVKAGKSTLVNALLAQRVAPTDVSECTRVVTWFTYGRPERLVISLRDGGEVAAQLTPDGMLPRELPVPTERVASIKAYLANQGLRAMTLIDTPGLGSVHDDYSRATRELLARSSTDAASAADAVVFLLGNAVMADEVGTLRLFREPEGDTSSPANAVGVLSRADQLSDGTRDSWEIAVELAGQYAGSFRAEMATVVPVAGLIAETAETATLTERDSRLLSQLAELEPARFERMLWSADRFTSTDLPDVSAERRERLLELLDLYGIGAAVAALREGASGATALRRELSRISGISAVKQVFSSYFSDQDHVLKVRSALRALERISFAHRDRAPATALSQLRADVERLRDDPIMHPIQELEVLHAIGTGQLSLPPELTEEVRRLFAPGGPQTRLGLDAGNANALREAARIGMTRWRTFMVEAPPKQAQAARVVMRSYQLIWAAIQ